MSMIKYLRRPLNVLTDSRRMLYRCQSQHMLELLNKKAPIEHESNDELENLPMENTIEWNKKLKFYRMRGEERKALKLFEIGLRKYRYQPDYITYVSMIEACKDIKDVDNGRYVHRLVHNSSVKENSRLQSLLMEMYIKCRDVDSAREVFDQLKNRIVVDYNTLMTAYNDNQRPERTLDLFHEMRDKANVKPNNISYMLYFQACVMSKAFDQGRAMHEELKKKVSAFMKNKELANQLISMYLASGDYAIAEELFGQVKEPTVPNYVGLMNHYNQTKQWPRTVQLYEQMKGQRRIQPDVPAYLHVFAAVKETNSSEKAKEIREDIVKQNLWQNHPEIQKFLTAADAEQSR